MGGAGKRLLLHTKFLLALFGGGQWLENLAKENPLSGGLTKTV